MLSDIEIEAIASSIVLDAKATARVKDGTLKRSIAKTYIKGEVIFREIYYGQYGDNSKLEELAKKRMPNGVPWKIVYTEFGGKTKEVGRTRMGRTKQSTSVNSAINSIKKDVVSNRSSTSTLNSILNLGSAIKTGTNLIKGLISSIRGNKPKTDGKATNKSSNRRR